MIDASSYSSGNVTRDKDVISPVLLDAGTYPELTFSSTAVRPDGDGWIVEGRLGAHGVTVPIEMRADEVRGTGDDAWFRVSARPRSHRLRRDEKERHGGSDREGERLRWWAGEYDAPVGHFAHLPRTGVVPIVRRDGR